MDRKHLLFDKQISTISQIKNLRNRDTEGVSIDRVGVKHITTGGQSVWSERT